MRRLVARWLRALARRIDPKPVASVPASTEAPDIERARADAQARRKEIHGQDSNERGQHELIDLCGWCSDRRFWKPRETCLFRGYFD